MKMVGDRLKLELKRKAFHSFSLLYASAYFVFGRAGSVRLLGVLLILESLVEFGRFFVPALNRRLLVLFGGIHRREELE